MAVSAFRLDQWTPLSHKQALGAADTPTHTLAPTWVGSHARRLTAYAILAAYVANAARHFLPTDSAAIKADHREYGDAAAYVAAVRSALLGDEQTIVVDGADRFDPDLEAAEAPPVPPEGTEPPEGAPDDDTGPTEEELRENAEHGRAAEREEWLRQWATDERLRLKVLEAEGQHAIPLGDAVYVLGWSNRKRRVRVSVYDPGFYFPVLDDNDEYPNRLHLAWEVDEAGQRLESDGTARGTKRRVRRITWEIRQLPEGETRRYPWTPSDEEPSTVSCYLTDATWSLGEKATPDDFRDAIAVYERNEDGLEVRDLDLWCDFIPVVHVPNTPAGAHHYGASSLLLIAQILDDLAETDSDTHHAAGTTGAPPIALSGVGTGTGDVETYGPGQVWKLGQDGKMSVLDTSQALVALQSHSLSLLDRMSVNGRMPAALMGRVKPSEVPSGVAVAFSFGPLAAMIEEMRLVRDEKYALLLKFVQRLSMRTPAEGDRRPLEPGEPFPARLEFGSFLPSDMAGLIERVTKLLAAKAISTSTAIGMLIDGGLPIDDAAEEVERIQRENFEAAVKLLDATGDDLAVRRFLGLPGEGPRPEMDPVAPQLLGPDGRPIATPPAPAGPEPVPTGGTGAA